eukprot:14865810-Alexandrium_andersonii.AAC.1
MGSSQVDFLCVPVGFAGKCSAPSVSRPSSCVLLESDHHAVSSRIRLRGAFVRRPPKVRRLPRSWEDADYEAAREAASIAMTDPSLPDNCICRIHSAVQAATQA